MHFVVEYYKLDLQTSEFCFRQKSNTTIQSMIEEMPDKIDSSLIWYQRFAIMFGWQKQSMLS